MSNINAQNIVSQNITVTNLVVSHINGVPYIANPCNNPCTKNGYYVPCPDCDYTGPDECDCGNTCDWCDEEPYIPDECDCFVPCPDKGGKIGRVNYWNLNSYMITKTSGTTGFNGIGYTGNVGIFGNLNITGLIDPTGLELTPQHVNPGSLTTLWFDDTSNNFFRVGTNKILLDNGSYLTTTIDNANILINDNFNNNTNSISSTSVYINDVGNIGSINLSGDGGVECYNEYSGNPNYGIFKASFCSLETTGGPKNTLTSGDITINDNGDIVYSQITADNFTLTDNNAASSTSLSMNSLTFNNSSVAPFINIAGIGGNSLNINGNGADIELNSNGSNIVMGDSLQNYHNTRIILNDNNYNIDLDCINLTANNNTYTYPICFSYKATGNISYGSAGIFQEVFHSAINFPSFVMDVNSAVNYCNWKIEFALNCRNMSDQTNKELAIYFELEDTNSAIYTPFLFNSTTPYTNHKNASTYPNTPNSENYTWSDYVDLSGVNGAVPLTFRVYWFANAANTFDFNLLVSFTKTNLLS